MTIPNNFYEIYQPKISTSQQLIKWRVWVKVRNKIYKKYNITLETRLDELEEHILKEFLDKMRKEL